MSFLLKFYVSFYFKSFNFKKKIKNPYEVFPLEEEKINYPNIGSFFWLNFIFINQRIKGHLQVKKLEKNSNVMFLFGSD